MRAGSWLRCLIHVAFHVSCALPCVACGDRSSGVASALDGGAASSTGATEDPCEGSGCVLGVEHVGDFDLAVIASSLSPGVSIDNGYSVHTLRFATSGREALATVALPFGVSPPAGGWHVVATNHGTSGLDDPCKVAGTIAGAGLAGTFAARGMIGVAVDYPGLGTPGMHPYLVADSEGHAALDALRAARGFARSRSIPLSGRFAMVGLSQGGHATLAAAARHRAYASELDLRGFAVVAPATAWEEHWRAGIQFGHGLIAVHAMLVHAWASHYRHGGPSPWSAAMAPRIDGIMSSACMYSATGAPALADAIGGSAEAVFSPTFLRAYRSGTWGPELEAFARGFRENRVGPYVQTAPLKIYQGDADVIVPEPATRALVEVLRAGGVEIDYEVVPGGGHSDVAFGFVAYPEKRTAESISWLRARLGD